MNIFLSNHAKARMIKRKITTEIVKETIRRPTVQYKKYGKNYFVKRFPEGKIEIVTEIKENNIKIITLYWL